MYGRIKSILAVLVITAFPAIGYEILFGEGTSAGESDLYLVPNGYGRLVFKYASIPLIDFDAKAGNDGARHWSSPGGIVTAAADDGTGIVTVCHRDFLNAGEATLVFKDGHLSAFRRKGGNDDQQRKDMATLTSHPKKPPTLPQLWRVHTEKQEEETKASWWKGDTRLRLGYFNPNAAGTLFAELAVLFASLALVFRRRWVRLLCAGITIGAFVALILTGSRGSFIALIVGIVSAVFLCFGSRFRRGNVLTGAVVAIVIAAASLFAVGRITNGRFGANLFAMDEGNVQRFRCWVAAPEMMAAAPGGWGEEPGRAYCDWFQGTDDVHQLYYLVNSHLTWLVQHGRVFRCGYVAAWLALLGLLFAFRGKRIVQMAFSVWVTFAVALWFSTVGIFPTLWIVPSLVGIAAFCAIAGEIAANGRAYGRRTLCVLEIALLIGGVLPLVLEWIGTRQLADRKISISYDGGAVRLGRGDVRIAILRDSTVLAGNGVGTMGHELRDWMLGNIDVGAVLVVDDPAFLPESVDCLIAAGKGGARYLRYRAAHLDDGKYCRPRRIVFISPPFPPTSIPYIFLQSTDAQVIIGEFAAMRESDYSRSRPWVTVVPACELYIPDWPNLALKGNGGGNTL